MKLVRCEMKKHYYDSEKNSFCPECFKLNSQSNMYSDKNNQSSLSSDAFYDNNVTVALDDYVKEPNNCQMNTNYPLPHNANTFFRNEYTDFGEAVETSAKNEKSNSIDSESPSFSSNAPFVSAKAEYVDKTSDVSMSSFAREISSKASTVHVLKNAPTVNSEEDECKTISIYEVNETEPVVGWIVCVKGEYFGESFKIKAGQNHIGRSAGMDICLQDELTVSRQNHAAIIFDPDSCSFFLIPGQSNGLTYLNNQVLLMPSQLTSYSEIRVGNASFVFVPLVSDHFNWKKYSGQ